MSWYRSVCTSGLAIVGLVLIVGQAAAQTEDAGQTPPASSESKLQPVADPAGTWRWEYNFNGNRVEGRLHLDWDDKQLVGNYTAYDRKSDIEQAELEKDQLSFVTKREFNGNQFVVTFSGQVKSDDIAGKVAIDFGGNRAQEFEWNPKRVVELDDVLGTWELRVETPGGIVEPQLTISKDGDKLRGKSVSNVLGERDAKNIGLKGNELSWDIAGEANGESIKIHYKGKPRGNAIEGTLEFDFNGQKSTRKFTGKRTPAKDEQQRQQGV